MAKKAIPTQPGVRLNRRDRLRKTAREKNPGCWVISPGRIYLFAAVEKALLLIARQRGWEVQRIEFIRVGNIEGDSRLFVFPTDEEDPERVPLQRYGRRLEANLSDDLEEWDLALPQFHQRRFDLFLAGKGESPLGPALYLDLNKPLESKVVDREQQRRKRKAKAQPPETESEMQEAAP